MRILILVATILLALMASCNSQPHAALQQRLPDPPYPIALIQSSGCHNPSPGSSLTCSFHKPAQSQSRVLAIYWTDTGGSGSVTDDANEIFTVFAPSVSKPNTSSSIYFLSTITQGTASVTVQPPSDSTTVASMAILELSGGAFAGSAANPVIVSPSCGQSWNCEYQNQGRFLSGAVPISSYSILVAAQLGIYSACSYSDGGNPLGSQMFNDPNNSACYNGGSYNGPSFTVINSVSGNAQVFCGNLCGFTVEVATASTPDTAPFFTFNPPPESSGATWTSTEVAIQ